MDQAMCKRFFWHVNTHVNQAAGAEPDTRPSALVRLNSGFPATLNYLH